MPSDAVKTLVQAFISCRLDYCSSLFNGISDGLMAPLQSVQNAAVELSTVWPCYTSCTGFRFGSEAGGLHDGHLGLPFVVRYGSGLPGRWFSAVVWRRSSSTAFCRLQDLCRQADQQQHWGPMLRVCWPKAGRS